MHRELTPKESEILNKLLSIDFPGVDELRAQLNNCKASDTGDPDNYGSIYLHPETKQSAPTTSNVPVEAKLMDSDEVPIFILLHTEEGLLHEMEIYKADGKPIAGSITPSELEVTVRN